MLISFLFLALAARAQFTYTVFLDPFGGANLCIQTDESGTNVNVAYLFCCENLGQLCASYTYENDVCSVTPKHFNAPEYNYPETTDDCCAAAKDDRSLVSACDQKLTDPILMKEVYEPESQTCTTISLSRDDYRDSLGVTSFLDYVSTSEFATRR